MTRTNTERTAEFQIDVDPPLLSDLKSRLKSARWPQQIEGTAWDAGTDTVYLKSLIEYWRDHYDWRSH
jgi:hypothetical protein